MIPVMLFGVLFAKKKYGLRDYFCVALITAGIVTFNLSKAADKNKEVRAPYFCLSAGRYYYCRCSQKDQDQTKWSSSQPMLPFLWSLPNKHTSPFVQKASSIAPESIYMWRYSRAHLLYYVPWFHAKDWARVPCLLVSPPTPPVLLLQDKENSAYGLCLLLLSLVLDGVTTSAQVCTSTYVTFS